MTNIGKTAIAALLAAVTMVAAAPLVSAQDVALSNTAEPQQVAQPGKPGGEGWQRQAHQGRDMRGQMPGQMRGQRGMNGAGDGLFVSLTCGPDAAERLETRLGNVAERLELTDDQAALFDELKTAALVAQTELSDSCPTPPARAERPAPGGDQDQNQDQAAPGPDQAMGNPIDRLEQRLESDGARIAAMQDLLPELRAFYDSLEPEQLMKLRPQAGPGQHNFGEGGPGHRAHDKARPGADRMGG